MGDHLGEGSTIAPPLSGAALDMLKIGKGVFVNSNLLAMARGGITIGDHARIAANVQLISNNHDPYDLDVLTCKPVEIGDYAWIGAGATILPGGACRASRRCGSGVRCHKGCAGLRCGGGQSRQGYQNAGQRKIPGG